MSEEQALAHAAAEREAEEAQLLEDLAVFEEELPHRRAAAVQDRALAIVYEEEARFLERRALAPAADRSESPAPDAAPEPDHDPGSETAAAP